MKKLALLLVTLFTMTVSASAMSYEQAREEALFLTDKMAYELNLTEDQYEAAYEINLDYLMRVNTVDDLYGTYWRYRNLDLSYILLDWQYRAFCDAAYFYRPIYWAGGYWHFGIYARYPYRDYLYFGRPDFYAVYRGGHSWRMNGGHSWYRGRRNWGHPDRGPAFGMRDGYQRGNYRNGVSGNRSFGNLNRSRSNVGNNRSFGTGAKSNVGNRSYGTRSNRSYGTGSNRSYGQFGSGARSRANVGSTTQNHKTRSFGGSRNYNTLPKSSTRATVTRSPQSTRSFGGSTRSMNRGSFERTPQRSTFSAPRSSSSSSRSFSAPRSTSRSSRSTSGSSHGSFGGHR